MKLAYMFFFIPLISFSSISSATLLFENDFESGIGANEKIYSNSSGNWAIHDQKTNPFISGSNVGLSGNVLGHVNDGYGKVELSSYELMVDLRGHYNNILSFDFDSDIQSEFNDGFSVVAYTDGSYFGNSHYVRNRTQPFTVLNPTSVSDMYFGGLGGNGMLDNAIGQSFGQPDVKFNGETIKSGTAVFNLNGFSDQVTYLRLVFGSDPFGSTAQGSGINIDNVSVNSVSEPRSLILVGLGLLVLTVVRYKKYALESKGSE